MNNRKVSKLGFTLIEVLIVVAIIGILASVVLVGLGPIQKQGRDARRIADIKQIQTGLELYYGKNGFYPKGFNVVATNGNSAGWTTFSAEIIGANIGVSNIPRDPSTAKNYVYGTDAAGTTYVLGALFDDPNNSNLSQSSKNITYFDCTAAGMYCVEL